MKLSSLIFLFVFLTMQVVAQGGDAADAKSPDMKFEVEEYNFGTIKQGEQVTFDFNFTNTGRDPLVITNAKGSCGCTVPDWPKEPIARGGKGRIHVVFNSTGKVGMQHNTVTLTSNAKTPTKILHLKGNVEAPEVSPQPAPVQQKN